LQHLHLPYLSGPPDPALDAVVTWFRRATTSPDEFFGRLVRRGIDEVLDGPRTGRWDIDQLEKTEKTYIGTKLEILVRSAFGLERDRAQLLDLEIEGHPVDVKWSKDSSWQIPEEAHGHLCLCLGARRTMTMFQVGVVRCRPEYLNLGRNKDQKTTLSGIGREAMEMLVPLTRLEPNFVSTIADDVRRQIMAEPTIQRRVTRLFQELPNRPIPRDAIRTIAKTEGDPIRRTRADAQNAEQLGGMRIISYKKSWQAEELGFPRLLKDEFLAVPVAEFETLPEEYRGTRRPQP
jgi:hypothetical protein